jgi:hypothetical protein
MGLYLIDFSLCIIYYMSSKNSLLLSDQILCWIILNAFDFLLVNFLNLMEYILLDMNYYDLDFQVFDDTMVDS